MAIADHARSRITQAGPILDAAAAERDMHRKRQLFTEAWEIVEPALYGLARRALNNDLGDRLIRDTMTRTATKLWRSIQTGYRPESGWTAGVYRVPLNAAVDTLKSTRAEREADVTSLDQRGANRDTESETVMALLRIADGTDLDEHVERVELRSRLTRASERAGALDRPLAKRILIIGIVDRPSVTAAELGITVTMLRSELDWIAENEEALFVLSRQGFSEYLISMIPEQSRLAVGA